MDILGQKRSFFSAYISKDIQFWFLYQVCNSSMIYLFQKDSLDFNRHNLALRRKILKFILFTVRNVSNFNCYFICSFNILISNTFWCMMSFWINESAQVPTFTELFPLMVCNTDLILHSTCHSNVSKNPHGCVRMAYFLQKYFYFAARQTEGKYIKDILQRDENNMGTRFMCISGKAGSDKLSNVTAQLWQSQEQTPRWQDLPVTTVIWIHYL